MTDPAGTLPPRPRRAAIAAGLLLAAGTAAARAEVLPSTAPPAPREARPTGPAPEGAPGGAPEADARILAVVGGTLLDGTGAPPVPDSAVVIEGGRIRGAGPRRQIRIPKGAVPVDATDLFVIPGLVDMHVHLIPGTDLSEFLRHGVTSVRHLGDTTLAHITSLKSRVEAGEEAGPRIFHCGLFVVSRPPLRPEAYPPADLERFLIMESPRDAAGVVARLLDAGADVVKVKTEMSPECLRALGAAAAEAGLPVSADNGDESGHYSALDALDAGARGIEHLSGILFEDPAATGAALERMLAAGAFAVPTFVTLDRTFSDRRVAAREAFVRKFAEAGGLVVAGSDSPSRGLPPGRSLHMEMSRLVSVGLTPMQALQAATGAAGRALGYQGLVGTIEAGAHADLVIVRSNPAQDIGAASEVVRVIKGGREVHPSGGPGEAAQSP